MEALRSAARELVVLMVVTLPLPAFAVGFGATRRRGNQLAGRLAPRDPDKLKLELRTRISSQSYEQLIAGDFFGAGVIIDRSEGKLKFHNSDFKRQVRAS